jgi:hypothetical protein
MNAQFIREALEHAPAQPATPPPANLRGHWLTGEASHAPGVYALHYVCAHCAGRLIARGVSLGRAEAVWKDRPQSPTCPDLCHSQCTGCATPPTDHEPR